MTRPAAFSALAAAALLAACGPDNEMPTASDGAAIFAENCAACHGSDAKGRVLPAGGRAPDLTTIAARNGGTLPRADTLSRIDGYGRGRVPSDVMPEFGALFEGPTVPVEVDGTMTPTPRPLAALLFYLESIQPAAL